MSEAERLEFIENRDGRAGAIDFALRTYKIYRKVLMQSKKRKAEKVHFATLPPFRRKFIESCVILRGYIYSRAQEGTKV